MCQWCEMSYMCLHGHIRAGVEWIRPCAGGHVGNANGGLHEALLKLSGGWAVKAVARASTRRETSQG